MFIRSLTIATLLACASPLFAAGNDSPLAQDLGKARPLIIITRSSLDPTLVSLQKALKELANKSAFSERNMVLYTVVNTIGQRDGRDLDAQSSMALIRSLNLKVSAQAKVILVGKDGEKKIDHDGPIELKEVFAAIDQMPMGEKEARAPAAAAPEPEAGPAKAEKGGKPGKGAPKTLDD